MKNKSRFPVICSERQSQITVTTELNLFVYCLFNGGIVHCRADSMGWIAELCSCNLWSSDYLHFRKIAFWYWIAINFVETSACFNTLLCLQCIAALETIKRPLSIIHCFIGFSWHCTCLQLFQIERIFSICVPLRILQLMWTRGNDKILCEQI